MPTRPISGLTLALILLVAFLLAPAAPAPTTRSRALALILLAAFLLALLPSRPTGAAVPSADLHPFALPDGFTQDVLAKDLGPATAFAFRPDGSILIARKHGSVKVLRDGKVSEAPFLDISGEVNNYGDRGLMGIAVHPDYPVAPYVYLAYAYEPPAGDSAAERALSGSRTARVIRVTVDPANPDKARDNSTVVILGANGAPDHAGNLARGDRPPYACMTGSTRTGSTGTGSDGTGGDGTASDGAGSSLAAALAPVAPSAPAVPDCLPVDGPSHTVDGLVFGPDGALYVSAGDGTLQPDLNVRAQNLDSLAGKVLRVDPLTGRGYADNPYYDGDPGSNRARVYALGLRNPYRFTFAPDGDLVVGDVGGERWEEINRGGPGANFGWPCLEGPLPNSGDPACTAVLSGSTPTTGAWHSYSHADGYSAAIGGDFYTGDRYPTTYQGAYFFADHNRAALLYLPSGAPPGSEAEIFATNVIAPVQITMGPDGALYVLSFVDGALSRIRYTGADSGAASAESNPSAAAETANSGATDTDATDTDATDTGATDTDATDTDATDTDATDTDATGSRITGSDATGSAGDNAGTTSEADVGAANAAAPDADTLDAAGAADPSLPTVRILTPADGSTWPADAEIALMGEATAAGGEPLTGDALQWTATLHHNDHVHPDFLAAGGPAAAFRFEPHAPNIHYELCLTATDGALATATACVDVYESAAAGQPPPAADTPAAGVSTANMPPETASAEDTSTEASIAGTPPSHAGPAGAATTQGIRRQRWLDLGGAAVADLTTADAYPAAPMTEDILQTFDTSGDGKDYGAILSGYLTPPASGDYTFWIAADDSGELWLSPSTDPTAAALIAYTTTWTPKHAWDHAPTQASAPIYLEAGQRYYIEARHKQADQKDNLSVAWQPPGSVRALIPATYLSPD